MARVPQRVLDWLNQVLRSNYRNVGRTYNDVAQLLETFPSFTVKTDVYTLENGSSALLLNVNGTLPVTFRGTVYEFPISTWVPQGYPDESPIVFVTPTRDMMIRPGQHISAEGRVYHPFLAQWHPETSTLLRFCLILQDVFAREPPVMAVGSQHRSPPPSTSMNAAPTHPPLPPKGGPSPVAMSPSHATLPPDVPVPPPKPAKQSEHVESKYDRPAPLPPDLTAQSPTVQSPYANGTPTQGTYGYAPARNPSQKYQSYPPPSSIKPNGMPQRMPSQNQYAQSAPQQVLQPAESSYQAAYGTASPHTYQPYRASSLSPTTSAAPDPRQSQQAPFHPTQISQQYPPQSQPPQRQASQPKPQQDLLTSPFDTAIPVPDSSVPPPPIPPNPQKDAILSALSENLTAQVHQIHSNTISAIAPLQAQQAALTSTTNAINREISQLNDLEAMLSSNEAILHQAMRDADKVLEDAKQRKVPNVDEVLVPPTVVAKQLYHAVAEQRAIEDCRAALAKALDKGRISSAVWAKQTRSLAREEFLKKALIEKIAQGMGLTEDVQWQ